MMARSESNPLHHTQKMRGELTALIANLRDDVSKVDEAQFKTMFETSAEVLEGLVKAFSDYEKKNEAAWRR